jgi:hypothetical protein
MFITILPYTMGDQIKEDEMNRTCGMYEGQQKYNQGCGGKLQRKESI